MRILFSTTAGAGHFGPLVPFARAVQRVGHDVLVVAPAEFRPAVEGAGFAFAPFAGRSDADAGAMFAKMGEVTSLEAKNRIMIRDGFGTLYPRAALPALLRLVDDWRPDVIVRETAEFASLAVAIGRGIPRAHVSIGLLGLMDMLGGEAMEPLAIVAAEYGLTIPSDTSPFLEEPTLTMTPPSLDDPGKGPTHRFRDQIEPTPPDPSLAGDDPLVYLTFGTEAAGMGFADLFGAALGMLAVGGWRVLATIGRGADPADLGPLPSGVRVESWMPQDAVLPHTAVVVFHGGYGTMLGALRAGVPLVTMPLFSIDQVANAKRAAERGVGVSLAGPEALGELAPAVSMVLADARFRSAAGGQAAAIRDLPAVEDSVAIITTLAG